MRRVPDPAGAGTALSRLDGRRASVRSVLNLGAVALLGSMVQQSNTLAAAGGDAAVQAIRHRRMATAMLRGFARAPYGRPARSRRR
ncbi:MAG: hypothetical protein WDO24_06400 [Pseudomonadota bacterium]